MHLFSPYMTRTLFSISSGLIASAVLLTWAEGRQQQQQPPPESASAPQETSSDEVIRVSVDLVQTDVMVFDKQGRFVEGLPRDQFELRVDGKPREIAFFDQVTAGSVDEDAQLAAARGGTRSSSAVPSEAAAGAVPLDRGRTIFFFVDDLHLSAASIARARKTLMNFIDHELGQNDQVAIASTSGQIGFLQQLTGNKTVLRAAVGRLNYRAPPAGGYGGRPPMTEYQALLIEQNDPDLLDFFIAETMRDSPGIPPSSAESTVRARARQISQQSTAVTRHTLATLESLMRSSAQLSGRKIVFFISDGFFLNHRESDMTERLRRITDAGARSGVVIYTMYAQGLATDPTFDASREVAFDPSGRISRSSAGELSASQELLHTLASDTGGRALINTNALNDALTKALKDTSRYYLLAWRPEGAEPRAVKFRSIEVRVKNRPELTVQVRRGFLDTPPAAAVRRETVKDQPARATTAPKRNTPDTELLSALTSLYSKSGLPTSLAVGYVSAPDDKTMLLMATLEIDDEALDYGPANARRNAQADVIAAAYNADGKIVGSFRQELSVAPLAAPPPKNRRIVYSNQFSLPPGLYQVRIAARDRNSGRIGSAKEWIEIPDLGKNIFLMSSIFVGERTADSAGESRQDSAAQTVMISADRSFSRNSWLRLMTHIYNASGSTTVPPDVALQIQIFRDDQPVVTTPLQKISTEGISDMRRIPYAADITLKGLIAGQYVLQVTAIDRAAKANTSQRTRFTVQ